MIRHFPVNLRELFPRMVLISLGVHCIIFFSVSISFPDRTTKNLPIFSFLGSILTEHDLTPIPKQASAVTRLYTLPEDFSQKSTQLSGERNILKPSYSPQIKGENKTDYKPELNAVNPKDAERKESDEKLLGIDLEPPPRPSFKLYKQ